MPTTETPSRTSPLRIDEYDGKLWVDCYVRATVPDAIANRITTVIDRLEHLQKSELIADYRVTQWPAEAHAVTETGGVSRHELVDGFEQWADDHGYSLEPAFRHQTVPSSPFSHEGTPRIERIRVPLIALALYDDATEMPPESESLCGVVPYTASTPAGTQQTYTIDQWLSTIEPQESESVTVGTHDEQSVLQEGVQ